MEWCDWRGFGLLKGILEFCGRCYLGLDVGGWGWGGGFVKF